MKLTQKTLRKMIREAIQEVEIGGVEFGKGDIDPENISSVDIVNDAIIAAERALEKWLEETTRGMTDEMKEKYQMIVSSIERSMQDGALKGIGQQSKGTYDKAKSMVESDPHHDELSDEEYKKDRFKTMRKQRKRMYGPTGHDKSRPLSPQNPFYLKESRRRKK